MDGRSISHSSAQERRTGEVTTILLLCLRKIALQNSIIKKVAKVHVSFSIKNRFPETQPSDRHKIKELQLWKSVTSDTVYLNKGKASFYFISVCFLYYITQKVLE